MNMRRIAIGFVLLLGLVLGGGSAAFAGEYRGHGGIGGDTPGGDKAHSICSVSGVDQDDSFEDNGPNGEGDDDFVTIHGTQSYGQWVRAGFKDLVPSPGVACNGSTAGE
jgi:hypothetical protein